MSAHLKALASLVLVVGSTVGCSTTASNTANDAEPMMQARFPHQGIYDLISLGGDSLPVTDTLETGEQMVIERAWMRLTDYGTVEWHQYGEVIDGTTNYSARMGQDGEWVRGSETNSGSIIWGWARFYLDGQLAESGNMPDSDEYRLTDEGLQFVTTGSVYRRR